MVAEAINDLGDTFDTHDVERRTLRRHPVAVAHEIIYYDGSDDVLRTFSAQFARYIDRAFPGQIRQTRKVDTENLGGAIGRCQQWVKLTPPVTVPAHVPPDEAPDDAHVPPDEAPDDAHVPPDEAPDDVETNESEE